MLVHFWIVLSSILTLCTFGFEARQQVLLGYWLSLQVFLLNESSLKQRVELEKLLLLALGGSVMLKRTCCPGKLLGYFWTTFFYFLIHCENEK